MLDAVKEVLLDELSDEVDKKKITKRKITSISKKIVKAIEPLSKTSQNTIQGETIFDPRTKKPEKKEKYMAMSYDGEKPVKLKPF